MPPPPSSTLFPYTTLFRSHDEILLAMLASRAAFVRGAAVAAVLLHVAEASQRFVARGRGGPSARGEVLHFRVHVEAELRVEVRVDVARPEAQVPAPRRDMHRQAGCVVAVRRRVTVCT